MSKPEPTEQENFVELMKKLVRVSKREVQDAERAEKNPKKLKPQTSRNR